MGGQHTHGLVRLGHRNVEVLLAVDEQHRNLHLFQVAQRGSFLQQLLVQLRIAILRQCRGGHPGIGVSVERLQIRHATGSNTAQPTAGMPGQGGVHQITTIRTTHDEGIPIGGQPGVDQIVQRIFHIIERREAPITVICLGELPALAQRTADIRLEHRVPRGGQLTHHVVVLRAGLPFRTAVEIHHHGRGLRGIPAHRLVQPTGELQAIARLISVQLRDDFRGSPHREHLTAALILGLFGKQPGFHAHHQFTEGGGSHAEVIPHPAAGVDIEHHHAGREFRPGHCHG